MATSKTRSHPAPLVDTRSFFICRENRTCRMPPPSLIVRSVVAMTSGRRRPFRLSPTARRHGAPGRRRHPAPRVDTRSFSICRENRTCRMPPSSLIVRSVVAMTSRRRRPFRSSPTARRHGAPERRRHPAPRIDTRSFFICRENRTCRMPPSSLILRSVVAMTSGRRRPFRSSPTARRHGAPERRRHPAPRVDTRSFSICRENSTCRMPPPSLIVRSVVAMTSGRRRPFRSSPTARRHGDA
jgi:hypothetical protein